MDKIFRIENLFVILAFLFGLFLVFYIPPLQSADEPCHFNRAFSVSEGHILAKKLNNISGDLLPVEIVEFENKFLYLIFNNSARTSFGDIEKSKDIKINRDNRIFADQKYQALYTVFAYAPQALGIKIFNLFTDSVYWLLIGAKIFLLSFYILLGYFSIKSIPFLKSLVFLILLMPMSLSLGASVSADGLLIATSIFFLSKIFQYSFQDSELTTKQASLVILLALLLVFVKQSFLIALFFLFIPHKKWGSYSVLKILGLIFLCFIVSVICSKVNYDIFVPLNNSNPDLQIKFIITNPLSYLFVLINTLKIYFKMLLFSMVGFLGWFDVLLFPFVYYLYFIFICFNTIFVNYEDRKFVTSSFQKIFLLLLSIVNFLVICTIIYVSWAVPGQLTPFEGLQGRYFIPLCLPFLSFFFFLFSTKQSFKLCSLVKILNVLFILLVYLNVWFALYIRFYSTY